MEFIKSASKQELRQRKYFFVAADILDDIDDANGAHDYVQEMHEDFYDTRTFIALKSLLHNLAGLTVHEPYDSCQEIFISEAFRNGFLFGFDINHRLVGDYATAIDDLTYEHTVTTFTNISETAKQDPNRATKLLRTMAVTTYFNNMAASDERSAALYNKIQNPLDRAIEKMLDGLYEPSDEVQRSLFCEGLGLARGAQIDHQKNIDEEFYIIHSSMGPIS